MKTYFIKDEYEKTMNINDADYIGKYLLPDSIKDAESEAGEMLNSILESKLQLENAFNMLGGKISDIRKAVNRNKTEKNGKANVKEIKNAVKDSRLIREYTRNLKDLNDLVLTAKTFQIELKEELDFLKDIK